MILIVGAKDKCGAHVGVGQECLHLDAEETEGGEAPPGAQDQNRNDELQQETPQHWPQFDLHTGQVKVITQWSKHSIFTN